VVSDTRAHAGEVSVMSGAPYGYRYVRKTDEVPAAYAVLGPRPVWLSASMRCTRLKDSASARSLADQRRRHPDSQSKCPLGTLDGLAVLRNSAYRVSPCSARPAPLHGRASSVRCVGAVWLRPAPPPATSARAKNGSRSPCRHCKRRELRPCPGTPAGEQIRSAVEPSRPVSCRGWSAVRSAATPSRVHPRKRVTQNPLLQMYWFR